MKIVQIIPAEKSRPEILPFSIYLAGEMSKGRRDLRLEEMFRYCWGSKCQLCCEGNDLTVFSGTRGLLSNFGPALEGVWCEYCAPSRAKCQWVALGVVTFLPIPQQTHRYLKRNKITDVTLNPKNNFSCFKAVSWKKKKSSRKLDTCQNLIWSQTQIFPFQKAKPAKQMAKPALQQQTGAG